MCAVRVRLTWLPTALFASREAWPPVHHEALSQWPKGYERRAWAALGAPAPISSKTKKVNRCSFLTGDLAFRLDWEMDRWQEKP